MLLTVAGAKAFAFKYSSLISLSDFLVGFWKSVDIFLAIW